MIYEDWYLKTLAIAQACHEGQVDRIGAPKIDHVTRVASKVICMFPDAGREDIQAALLHDTLEDSGMTVAGLLRAGMPVSVVTTVKTLTRDKEVAYLDYVRGIAISGGISAIRVKLADNADNGDPKRPDFPGRRELMEERYIPARLILEKAVRERGFYAQPAKAAARV